MSFLLDTVAASETRKQRPDAGYVDWLAAQEERNLYMSVMSLGELRRGVLALPAGARRASVEAWLTDVVEALGERIVPIDRKVVNCWAELTLAYRARGQVVGLVDELIAATALSHGLTLVTRNVRHFEASGCKLVSPWAEI